MALEQTRPYQLDTFVDDGSISDDDLYVLLDNSTYVKPKKIARSSLGGGGASHVEKDTLTGLVSRTVSVTFGTSFPTVPIGREPEVYRMYEEAPGKWRRREVLWGFVDANQPTTDGFELEIDSSESLTGVIVEYIYQ